MGSSHSPSRPVESSEVDWNCGEIDRTWVMLQDPVIPTMEPMTPLEYRALTRYDWFHRVHARISYHDRQLLPSPRTAELMRTDPHPISRIHGVWEGLLSHYWPVSAEVDLWPVRATLIPSPTYMSGDFVAHPTRSGGFLGTAKGGVYTGDSSD